MKREILKEEQYEDGSYARIEKVTQTPEDGFVSYTEHQVFRGPRGHHAVMSGRWKVKGYKTTITYENTNPKVVRPLFYLAYTLATLLFVVVFTVLISIQKDPDTANELKLYFAVVAVFLGYGFIKSILTFRKQDKQREKECKQGQQKRES